MNPLKTHKATYEIELKNNLMKITDKVKALGVMLSVNLNWNGLS